jgi:Holliday junction resolvasome RuvABC endonuclease subunit
VSLSDLIKHKASTVIGIDASTNSIAFCLIKDGVPERYGKILLNGQDIYEKIADARNKVHAMKDMLSADYIAMEGAIMVKSADAVIKLSYVYGVVLGELMQNNPKVITVAPSSWQSFIGNNNLNNVEKARIKAEFPDKSDSWYKSKMRETRKEKTVTWVKKAFNIELDDFDVADSFGIANYAYKKLTER